MGGKDLRREVQKLRMGSEARPCWEDFVCQLKNLAFVLLRRKASDGFKQRWSQHQTYLLSDLRRRVRCWGDTLENSGEESSLLREKGSKHFVSFLVIACK